MSFGAWIVTMIVIYFVVKSAVRNGMAEYYCNVEKNAEPEIESLEETAEDASVSTF